MGWRHHHCCQQSEEPWQDKNTPLWEVWHEGSWWAKVFAWHSIWKYRWHNLCELKKLYIEKILKRFGKEDCKPRCSPCEMDPNAYTNDSNAMVCTRPDLSYVVTLKTSVLPNNWRNTNDKARFFYAKRLFIWKIIYHQILSSPDFVNNIWWLLSCSMSNDLYHKLLLNPCIQHLSYLKVKIFSEFSLFLF